MLSSSAGRRLPVQRAAGPPERLVVPCPQWGHPRDRARKTEQA